MSRTFLFILFLLLTPLVSPPAFAETYYVDPREGNDERSGLTRDLAWQHIPGACSPGNTGFLKTRGWTRLRAGDTILVKSGSVIRNRLIIDAAFYGHGTTGAPIRVMRDTSWGSGPVVFDGGDQALGRWDGLIAIRKRDHIMMDGVTAAGMVVQHSRGRGIDATGATENNKMAGLVLRNMKLYDNTKFNAVLQRCEAFLVENVEIDGNGRDTEESGGFHVGGNGYSCSTGRFVNCRSYRNGARPGSQAGYTDARIGFWLVNSTGITFENCTAHDNAGRGFDAGVEGAPPRVITDNIKYVNCDAYRNSAGFGCNLDDVPGKARFWYVNCIARDNGLGWFIYDGPTARVYNCLAARNRCGVYIDAKPAERRGTWVEVRNTILHRNSDGSPGSADLWIHRADSLTFSSDYNYFEGSEERKAVVWNGASTDDAYPYNGQDAPGSRARNWYKRHRQDGESACSIDGGSAGFVNEQGRNYRLTSKSRLIGRGAPPGSDEIPELARDRDGRERPRSGKWDIGPYLFTAPTHTSFTPQHSASLTPSPSTSSE